MSYSRIARIDDGGVCKLGIERKILIPCTAYEFCLNVRLIESSNMEVYCAESSSQTYLTYLFLAPLRSKCVAAFP